MHSTPAMPTQRGNPHLRRLILLSALVLLVHGLLLGGMNSALSLFSGQPDAAVAPPVALRFVTRTVAPQPALTPAPVRPRPARKATAPVTPPAVTRAAAPPTEATLAADPAGQAALVNPPASTGDRPQPATTTNSNTATASGPGPSPDPSPDPVPSPAPAPPSAPPAAAGSEAPPVGKPLLPPPVRLLFDGRGEERGFVKYAASAELLWQPAGSTYSARLEISAWGIRIRTWTSKGSLTDSGLQPTRFGDKPRGAELATHFQRDKGIISFSANNPDVPLQAGAQDKLSALLQLSAIVAGEPERYSAGTTIQFQAADAHRAEPWDFKVGALETLELPGGKLSGLKLSREPSLEFDQRIEVWLSPDNQYLPMRLRITEANGAFADLLWRNTQKPD